MHRLLLVVLFAIATIANAQSPLVTLFALNSGGANGGAVYFELECLDPTGLTISDLDLNAQSPFGGTTASCQIYLQPLAPGVSCNPSGAWLGPLHTGSAALVSPPNTPTNFVLSPPMVLAFGDRYCVAIVGTNFTHGYSCCGPPAQPLVYATTELRLVACCASNVPFQAPFFQPRVVNIRIPYVSCVGGNCPTVASCTAQGDGCLAEFASFYEVQSPATFDLVGLKCTGTNTSSNPAATSYVVTTSPGTARPIGMLGPPQQLQLGDDQVVAAGTLGLFVSSNGIVFRGPGGTNGFFPSVAALLNQPVQLWANWNDYNPSAAGSGQVFYEQNGSVAQITFDGVFTFGTQNPNTFQFVIDTANGDFEMTFGQASANNAHDYVTGYSPAGQNLDPGEIDISAATTADPIHSVPFDTPPLLLTCIGRPVQGPVAVPFCVETSNISANAILHLGIIGLGRPAFPLGAIGFPPPCSLWADLDVVLLDAMSPPPAPADLVWCPLVLPPQPTSFSGFEFNLQAITLALGPPLIGPTSRASNGLKCVVGDL